MKLNQICSRCVMDEDTPEIVFNSNNICNFCSEFLSRNHEFIHVSNEKKK